MENELFPKWGVKYAATFYWLKVFPSNYGRWLDSRLSAIESTNLIIDVTGESGWLFD